MFNKKLQAEVARLEREVKRLNRELEKTEDSRIHLRKIIKAKDKVIKSLKGNKNKRAIGSLFMIIRV